MNEQIKQLAIKANPSSKQIYDVAESWPYNCAAWSGEDLSNLVKLVVQETLDIVNNSNSANQCMFTTYDQSVVGCVRTALDQEIRKHFNLGKYDN
jgi:hypothetical protein